MEQLDLYKDKFIKTDKVITRGDPIPQDHYALVVFICLFNPDGQLLIQRRQLSKKGWPGMWDVSCGGAVSAGESSRQAAVREVQEELGITLDPEQLTKTFTLYYDTTIHDIYTCVSDFMLEDIRLQEEEVMDVRFADLDEIEAMINDGTFIPIYKEFMHLLFVMKDRKGILR